MDLNHRKLRILRAIVDEYILSGAPVGSKVLSQNPSFRLSSATIRNEMADLEDLGYLEQPHTSAGRVPSDKAYRLYVNNMMQRSNLSADEMETMSAYCRNRVKGLDAVMRETANVLSSITHYTALVTMPENAANRLRHLQLVPLADGYALVVVVTDAGVARDAVIHVPTDMGPDELDKISRTISQRYYNCRMSELTGRLLREMGSELLDKGAFLQELADTMEAGQGANAQRIALSGANNLLDYPAYGDIDRARQLLAEIEKKDTLYRLLKNAGVVEFSFRIGSELGTDIFKDCSLVTATYRIGTTPVGTMGVIGPTRMPYGKVVTVLDYMSKSLGGILTNVLEEE
ncbi:MAG: heat-inducible transcription repressor HrcA [Clostridia bacterium]|nr:heat-inducible transcription repressor HrcA [Clostridia bacterium]